MDKITLWQGAKASPLPCRNIIDRSNHRPLSSSPLHIIISVSAYFEASMIHIAVGVQFTPYDLLCSGLSSKA